MAIISNPLTMSETAELIALKQRIDADTARLKELTDLLKDGQKVDGIVQTNVALDGEVVAFVLYSQNRINETKFRAAYPQNKFPHLYKLAADTTKVRKELNEEKISAVSTPVRALKVTTLAEAEEAEDKYKD